MRIYELLKMREGLRFLRIKIEELREILSCEHSYGRFADFKRWVLEKAREELKEETDIYFNYKVERDGQTPVRVNFVIKQNEPEDTGDDRTRLIESEKNEGDENLGVNEGRSEGSPTFNVLAMVLDELSQSELNDYSEKEIRQAIDKAQKQTENDESTVGAANQAVGTYQRALSKLRR